MKGAFRNVSEGESWPEYRQRLWEAERQGVPDGNQPYYGRHHPRYCGAPWRGRDRIARIVGFHCWDCLVLR